MAQIILVTLVGLPGSGKSRVCSKLVQSSAVEDGVCWIQYDAVIPHSVQRALENAESGEWKRWRQAIIDKIERWLTNSNSSSAPNADEMEVDLFSGQIPTFKLSNRIVVLLDDNFYYRSMRYPFFLLAKKSLENPFDNVDEINRLAEMEKDREINIQNITHAVDKMLRQQVTELMQQKDSNWKSKNAKLISSAKKKTLDVIRYRLAQTTEEELTIVELTNDAICEFHKLLNKTSIT